MKTLQETVNTPVPKTHRRAAAWLLAVLACVSALQAAERKPSFLFLCTDDHRWDAMGVVQREQGERARFPWFQSPNMDRLAADSALTARLDAQLTAQMKAVNYTIPADANQPKPAAEKPAAPGAGAVIPREIRDISGWRVYISRKLLESEPDATARALTGLKKMLDEIGRVVRASAVTELRKVPLYFSPAYKPGRSGAEFHPDASWLRDNGRDPAMARGVEFSGVHDFEAEMRRMPNFALHELAHAYQFRALRDGFDNADIKAAYDRAKVSGSYDRVERSFGEGNGRPNTFERAYAMTNPMEYFAETTEAYFTRNDFFPFTREELKRHDPAMFALLEKLWGVPDAN